MLRVAEHALEVVGGYEKKQFRKGQGSAGAQRGPVGRPPRRRYAGRAVRRVRRQELTQSAMLLAAIAGKLT